MLVTYCRTSNAWLLTSHTSDRLLSVPWLDVGVGGTRSTHQRPPAPILCVVPAAGTDPCKCVEGPKLSSVGEPRSFMSTTENKKSPVCFLFLGQFNQNLAH